MTEDSAGDCAGVCAGLAPTGLLGELGVSTKFVLRRTPKECKGELLLKRHSNPYHGDLPSPARLGLVGSFFFPQDTKNLL